MTIHLICPNPALDRTLLVDKFERNIPIRPNEVKDFPGGKGFNVAYALKQNGVDDYIIHTILGGKIGEYIEVLNEEKGNRLCLTKSQFNTRICNIYVENGTGDLMLFYEKGLDSDSHLEKSFLMALESQLKPDDMVVFSGSLLKGMPDNFIQMFIENHPNNRVIVDTSGNSLKYAYQSHPYFIKINNEEYKELHESLDEKNVTSILEHLTRETHANMIITMGSQGSVVKLSNQYYHIVSPKISAKNPIASGDFYLGLLIKGLYREENPMKFLKEASAYATANCLNYFPEVCSTDYENILKQVTITML